MDCETAGSDVTGQLADVREILVQRISADVIEKVMTLITPVNGEVKDFERKIFLDGDYFVEVEKFRSICYISIMLNAGVWGLHETL
jgi:hypothetical protein